MGDVPRWLLELIDDIPCPRQRMAATLLALLSPRSRWGELRPSLEALKKKCTGGD